MDKTKQVWYRYSNDIESLKVDCVDVLSKCYLMLGQKPDVQQVVLMSQLLLSDLANHYGSMTIDEVRFAIEKGIREGDEVSCFINVRSWNLWIKKHKKSEQLKRQQKLITDYEKDKKNQKLIASTIKRAKLL
jgi:hypothetical protein